MNAPSQVELRRVPQTHWYDCKVCEHFGIEGGGIDLLVDELREDKRKRALVRHTLYKMHRNNKFPILTREHVGNLLQEGMLPSPQEQANNLILWLGDQSRGPGEGITFWFDKHGQIIGSQSSDGFVFIFKNLMAEGYLAHNDHQGDQVTTYLSFRGWEKFSELKKSSPDSRTAFMAMSFGNPDLDRVYRECFKPAVARTGFELRRVDEKQPAGLIDNQLRVAIRASRFLIADLTHGNQGAYWEAGFAEGQDKPVIYTCEKSHFEKFRTHFDTNHHLTIQWSTENFAEAADALAATIRNTLPAEAKLTD
jgi:hypothetical protein